MSRTPLNHDIPRFSLSNDTLFEKMSYGLDDMNHSKNDFSFATPASQEMHVETHIHHIQTPGTTMGLHMQRRTQERQQVPLFDSLDERTHPPAVHMQHSSGPHHQHDHKRYSETQIDAILQKAQQILDITLEINPQALNEQQESVVGKYVIQLSRHIKEFQKEPSSKHASHLRRSIHSLIEGINQDTRMTEYASQSLDKIKMEILELLG